MSAPSINNRAAIGRTKVEMVRHAAAALAHPGALQRRVIIGARMAHLVPAGCKYTLCGAGSDHAMKAGEDAPDCPHCRKAAAQRNGADAPVEKPTTGHMCENGRLSLSPRESCQNCLASRVAWLAEQLASELPSLTKMPGGKTRNHLRTLRPLINRLLDVVS